MGKKLVAGMVLLLFFWISGCADSNTRQSSSTPVNTPAKTEIPTDTEIVEGLKTSRTPAGGKTVGEQNEDILELKHWKYGSERAQPSAQQTPDQPVSPQPPQQPQLPVMDDESNWEAVSIPIISEEEMVQIIRRLIDLGYLAEPVSHQDFQAAISDFQRDNSLPATGKLDGPTRELLRDK
jgi:hypothetical protein